MLWCPSVLERADLCPLLPADADRCGHLRHPGAGICSTHHSVRRTLQPGRAGWGTSGGDGTGQTWWDRAPGLSASEAGLQRWTGQEACPTLRTHAELATCMWVSREKIGRPGGLPHSLNVLRYRPVLAVLAPDQLIRIGIALNG